MRSSAPTSARSGGQHPAVVLLVVYPQLIRPCCQQLLDNVQLPLPGRIVQGGKAAEVLAVHTPWIT